MDSPTTTYLSIPNLSLFLCVGLILTSHDSIFAERGLSSWSIPPDKWDTRLLRSHAPYLVEGKGGLGVVLGENERILQRLWGSPDHRDYGAPERIFYKQGTFKGSFSLRRGRIIEIRYHGSDEVTESLKWLTALGLRQTDIEKLKTKEAMDKIIEFYKNIRYTRLPKELIIPNRGIHFIFGEKGVREIRIFKPFR